MRLAMHRWLPASLFATALVLLQTPAAQGQQPAGLFVNVSGPVATAADSREMPDRVRLRRRTVRIDFSRLGTRGDAARTLRLNLFEDAQYEAVLDRIDATADGFVWTGHVSGIEHSTVSLASVDGVMSGLIQTADGTFTVSYAGDDVHAVTQIDQSALPPDAEPAIPPASLSTDAVAPAAAQNDDGSTIDVLVLYTPAAVAAAGGTSGINALIANAVSLTNTSYANSDVAQRIRLVRSEPVSYTESGNFSTDLDNLTNGAGALSGVAALRDTYRADMVSLVNYTPSSAVCGIAWLMTQVSAQFANHAYSVIDQRCAVNGMGFAHELGHNMGLRHDWYLDSGVTPYTYAHGHVNIGTTSSTRWRTIMSYANKCSDRGVSCAVIPYWSNPLLTYSGSPLGVPAGTSTACAPSNQNNPSCDTDEHRVLNSTGVTVANFRQSGAPLAVTSLTPNAALPLTAGTTVTWTATTSGGIAPLQYQFWRFTDGSGWSLVQAYGSSNTYTWSPGAGTHALQVWVRNAASSAAYDAWLGTGTFTIAAPSARLTSFGSNIAFPAAFNVPITFTATASAGATAVEYKFWRYSTATGWTVARDYSSTNTYTWFPPLGSNALQVWVRAVGSTSSYEDWTSTGAFDVVSPPARISAVQANVAFPASPNTTITWTALASGGSGALEYKFYRFDPSTGWVIMRDWASSSQASWTPGAGNAGEHAVQVWVRSVGSSAAYEDWKGTGTFLIAAPEVSLTPDRLLIGLRIGEPVTWTASVSGPIGSWEFKFIAFDGTSWKVLQDYASQNTFTWFPPAQTCALQVWVRAVGSSAAWEQYQSSGLFVVSP